jgi:hypothetical protein
MNVNNELPKIYTSIIKALTLAAIIIVWFVVGYEFGIRKSVGSPDYEKSEIAKEITKKLIDYDISRTDSSQIKIDSVINSYKGARYVAKSISSVIYLEDGRKVIYSCTEDNKLLSLQLINRDSSIIELK